MLAINTHETIQTIAQSNYSSQKKPAGIPLGEATLIQYLISSV
jgi:hypothetical protein